MYKYRYGDKKFLLIVSIFILATAILGGVTLYSLRFITDYAVAGELGKLLDLSKILLIVLGLELVFSLMASYFKALYPI